MGKLKRRKEAKQNLQELSANAFDVRIAFNQLHLPFVLMSEGRLHV